MNIVQQNYPEFYNHPVIRQIAADEKWTISTADKIPVDMYNLIYHRKVSGATFQDSRSLCTLDELIKALPHAPNHTYYLNAVESGFVIVDIEPSCPEEIKQELLQLPYLYGEVSNSGKGYHLVMPLPKNFNNYPDVTGKPAIKEKHGYYEILLNHYAMFTKRTIPKATGNKNFEQLYGELAAAQKPAKRTDFYLNDFDENIDIPEKDRLLNALSDTQPKKTLNDFNGDESRYEFAVAMVYNTKLATVILALKKQIKAQETNVQPHEYTKEERAYLIYSALKENLPYREKHNTIRQGLPWLLYLAQEVIAKADEQSDSDIEDRYNDIKKNRNAQKRKELTENEQ